MKANQIKKYVVAGIGILTIVLFFSDWIEIDYFINKLSIGPHEIISFLEDGLGLVNIDLPASVYLVYLIPLTALCISICAFTVKDNKFKLIAILGNIVIIITIAVLIICIAAKPEGVLFFNYIEKGVAKLKAPFNMTIVLVVAGIIISATMSKENKEHKGRGSAENSISQVKSDNLAVNNEPYPSKKAITEIVNNRYFLTMTNGDLQGLRVELTHERIVIGRNPEQANIVLREMTVSRRHCAIWIDERNGNPLLEQFSQAPLWVNNFKVNAGDIYSLNNGDVLQLGNKSQVFKVSTQ